MPEVIRLYHGGLEVIETPSLLKCRANTDFGRGFYTTTIMDQALARAEQRWATLSAKDKRVYRPIVNIYEFDKSALRKLRFRDFGTRYSEEWLKFVIACRHYNFPTAERFDIVYGPVADDRIYRYAAVEDYVLGKQSLEKTLEKMKFHEQSDQFSFHTREALNHLRFAGYEKFG